MLARICRTPRSRRGDPIHLTAPLSCRIADVRPVREPDPATTAGARDAARDRLRGAGQSVTTGVFWLAVSSQRPSSLATTYMGVPAVSGSPGSEVLLLDLHGGDIGTDEEHVFHLVGGAVALSGPTG